MTMICTPAPVFPLASKPKSFAFANAEMVLSRCAMQAGSCPLRFYGLTKVSVFSKWFFYREEHQRHRQLLFHARSFALLWLWLSSDRHLYLTFVTRQGRIRKILYHTSNNPTSTHTTRSILMQWGRISGSEWFSFELSSVTFEEMYLIHAFFDLHSFCRLSRAWPFHVDEELTWFFYIAPTF